MQHVLFVCARNRLRSPTAEAIFSGLPGIEVSSAGTAPDSECIVSRDLIEWADIVFVMERRQEQQLQALYGDSLRGRRLVCLNIPDRFRAMQPELIALLQQKVMPRLSLRAE